MYNFYYENLPLKSGVGGDLIVNDTLGTSLGGIAVMLKWVSISYIKWESSLHIIYNNGMCSAPFNHHDVVSLHSVIKKLR